MLHRVLAAGGQAQGRQGCAGEEGRLSNQHRLKNTSHLESLALAVETGLQVAFLFYELQGKRSGVRVDRSLDAIEFDTTYG